MKKLTSYQRLKEKNEELREEISKLNGDLRILVLKPEGSETARMTIQGNVRIKFDIENSLWEGVANRVPHADGLFSAIKSIAKNP